MDKKASICKHINCNEPKKQGGWDYCHYHQERGPFGFGETYEQYQIIEQDFIDFIKVVPLEDRDHHSVHSPVLRDIILRTCSQIEIFFKEWGLFMISEGKNPELLESYNKKYKGKIGGERNWNFGDYFSIKTQINNFNGVYVRQLDEYIQPFKSWTNDTPPEWWNAYNSIKHGGLNSKKESTLKNSLYAIAALFQLHCSNDYSRKYLQEFTTNRIIYSVNDVYVHFNEISTPIDSKRFLFKYGADSSRKELKLITDKRLESKLRELKSRRC